MTRSERIGTGAMGRRGFLAGLGATVAAAVLPARSRGEAPDGRMLRAEPGRLSIPGTPFGDLALPVWAYEGRVPGPLLRFSRGDRAKLWAVNGLDEATSIHWHGLRVPNRMDGAAPLTQPPIEPGAAFEYVFDLKDAGTYWYHTHMRGWNQQDRGLYGALIVDEDTPPEVDRDLLLVLDDWLVEPDGTIRDARFGNMHDWAHAGRLGTLTTVNSTSEPGIPVTPGERLRLRLVNVANAQVFSLAFAGHDPWLVAEDGDPVRPRRLGGDGIVLGPGQRADVILDAAAEPGSSHAIRAVTLSGEGAIARLDYAREAGPTRGLANAPVAPLEGNLRREPDLAGARRLRLDMEGGAMGSLGRGLFQGRMMGFRELAANRRVWAFNGIAGDMREPLARLGVGETAVLEIVNDTRWPHSIHLHGMHFRILSPNGGALGGGFRDTVTMGPMDRAEIAFVAEAPGKWMLHCHMIEHQAGGMMTWLDVTA